MRGRTWGYLSVNDSAPAHIPVVIFHPCRWRAIPAELRSASSNQLAVGLLLFNLSTVGKWAFRFPAPVSATVFHHTWPLHRGSQYSDSVSKHFSFTCHIRTWSSDLPTGLFNCGPCDNFRYLGHTKNPDDDDYERRRRSSITCLWYKNSIFICRKFENSTGSSWHNIRSIWLTKSSCKECRWSLKLLRILVCLTPLLHHTQGKARLLQAAGSYGSGPSALLQLKPAERPLRHWASLKQLSMDNGYDYQHPTSTQESAGYSDWCATIPRALFNSAQLNTLTLLSVTTHNSACVISSMIPCC